MLFNASRGEKESPSDTSQTKKLSTEVFNLVSDFHSDFCCLPLFLFLSPLGVIIQIRTLNNAYLFITQLATEKLNLVIIILFTL